MLDTVRSQRPSISVEDTLRAERDRHVAFAFAAADVLIEAEPSGRIVSVSGAASSTIGYTIKELAGMSIEALVEKKDRTFIGWLLKRIGEIGRIDPVALTVAHRRGKSNRILLGGCCLPNMPGRLFLSATLLPNSIDSQDLARDDSTGLLTRESLGEAAARSAAATGGSTTLKMVQLDGLSGAARQLAPERAALLMEEIGAALRSQSVGGDAAGRIGEDSFGIVTKVGEDLKRDATLLADIGNVINDAGVPKGRVSQRLAQVSLSAGALADADVGRSILYAMNSFVRTHGKDFNFTSLSAGLAASVSEVAARVTSTRRMITEGGFTLVYQPVVSIDTRLVHHYESLSRFPGTANAFETIVFSEDTGLIYELDIAVCTRAIEALNQNPGARLAVNISGQSIQNEQFRAVFGELVRPLNGLRDRLLFELTESAMIEDLEDAAGFLRNLRRLGHAVCIDDFGAGAAAYSYLRRFDVDFVKIDGPFLKAAVDQPRDRALIRSICVLAREIGCSIIGEMIEDEPMAALASELGIAFGQGWLFGKPLPTIPKPIIVGRRKGASESWE